MLPREMIGQTLGSYRIVDKIGEGGMGAVYLAEHLTLGRRAAIKVLLPERAVNPGLVERFFHEAKTTAMLQHPNLVDIYDFGTEHGHSFIVMEYLVGESLAVRMHRERPLPLTMIYTLGRQIATALEAAHSRNIVHRDLKPENVFLVFDADAPFQARVKVLDFGLAKLAGDASAHSMTRTGALLGTPLYMSPEQCRGIKEIDTRTDVYALGCILYEMATGRPPFVREAIGDLMVAHIQEPPQPPHLLAGHIPPDLESLILACLAKRPDQRVQTMHAIAVALEQLLAASSGVIPERMSSPMIPGTNGIAATPASTTLATATGQLTVPRPSSSKRALVIGTTATVLAGSAVAAIMLASPTDDAAPPRAGDQLASNSLPPDSAVAEVVVAPPVDAAVQPPVDAAIPTEPPKADEVTLTITSTPSGAEIRRKSDNSLLGTTPATIQLPKGTTKLPIVAKRSGHRSDVFLLDVSKPNTMDLKLRPRTVASGSGGVKDGAYDPFAPKK